MGNFYYKLITSKLLNLSVGGYLCSNSTVLFDFDLFVSVFWFGFVLLLSETGVLCISLSVLELSW